MAQISLKNSDVYLWYGGDNYVKIRVGEGNISWSEKRTIEYTLDRGKLAYVDTTEGGAAREGDDQPMDTSFDLLWDWSSARNPVAVLKGDTTLDDGTLGDINSAHADDTCAPHAVTIEVVYNPDCAADAGGIVHYILPFFRWETLNYDIGAGQISASGTCQAKEVIVDTTQSSAPLASGLVTMS